MKPARTRSVRCLFGPAPRCLLGARAEVHLLWRKPLNAEPFRKDSLLGRPKQHPELRTTLNIHQLGFRFFFYLDRDLWKAWVVFNRIVKQSVTGLRFDGFRDSVEKKRRQHKQTLPHL